MDKNWIALSDDFAQWHCRSLLFAVLNLPFCFLGGIVLRQERNLLVSSDSVSIYSEKRA
jgi:hypothetical protein